MNILYTVNNGFVPQLACGICSVCENNREESQIHFYVFSLGITDENKEKLEALAAKYEREISIIEIKDMKEYLDFEFDTLGWSPVILARLFMGKILPPEVERILYMDGDTVVVGSLHELWNTDLDDKVLGMSVEPTADRKRKEELGLKGYYYHNSGVLLVDVKKWREVKAEELLINFYREKEGKLFAADQDALNGALKDQIYHLLPKYNFCNIYYQYPYRFLAKLIAPMQYFSKEEFEDCKKHPVIIHFLGEERPWRRGNTHKYRQEFHKYLEMTEWKDLPMEEGWGTYFICWRIFNFFTKPFPGIRYGIINGLIPYFMKYRAKQLKKDK